MTRSTEKHSTYIPPWLDPLLSDREYDIITHNAVKAFYVDQDGNLLPEGQQIMSSPLGEVWLDSHRKSILSS